MKRIAIVVAAILLLVFWMWSVHSVVTGDGWPHDLYCAGKIDKFDPWCP